MTPGPAQSDDEVRRTRLIATAAAAMVVYLLGAVAVELLRGEPAVALVALGVALLAALTGVLARRKELAAAEWTTAALVGCSSIALIAMEGPVSSRLGLVQIGAVLLGLAARPWMALVQVALAIALVQGATALGAPIPLAPSTTPVWIGIVQQILLTTALMLTFTHGYGRLHATLARRTATLEAAHAELIAARAHLEQLVGERTAELERATVDLEAFSATVAHDLRAPLRHVRHFLQLFTEDAGALGEARLAPVAEVLSSAGELTATVETILAAHRTSRPR